MERLREKEFVFGRSVDVPSTPEKVYQALALLIESADNRRVHLVAFDNYDIRRNQTLVTYLVYGP